MGLGKIGAGFALAGAVGSHTVVGDGIDLWLAPAVFGLICLASWALRAASRRL